MEGFAHASFAYLNTNLLTQLGFDNQGFACDDNLSLITGNYSPSHLQPLSTVYAGHQFGVYTSRLGDGRVHILGDIAATDGKQWEVQVKGAGATPFARGNNGRMSLAEAIMEYLGCESMAGLGIAGTRGLALVTHYASPTLMGIQAHEGIFVRTAETHLRFGHFEYLHNQGELPLLKKLADHVIAHYYPELMAFDDATRYLHFLYAVTQRTVRLIAGWQAVGFVHSVMNTDNMSIIGLTMDYGVYGFMETYDPTYSPNDNDDQDRYAFNQQVDVGRWNCLALAEALIELLPNKRIPASFLRLYREAYTETYQSLMRKKLGLCEPQPEDVMLVSQLLDLLKKHHIDYTRFFRQFARVEQHGLETITANSHGWHKDLKTWFEKYQQRLTLEKTQPKDREIIMLIHNPKFILRQDMLKHVICLAEEEHNFAPLQELLLVLQSPYAEHERHEYLA